MPSLPCRSAVIHTTFAIQESTHVITSALVFLFQQRPNTRHTNIGTAHVKIQLIVVTTVGWKFARMIAAIPTITIMIRITRTFSFSDAFGLKSPPYRSYAKMVDGQRDVIANVESRAPRKDAQISATTHFGKTASIIAGVIIIAFPPISR